MQDCVYLAVTASEYPQRTVFKFLDEVPPLPSPLYLHDFPRRMLFYAPAPPFLALLLQVKKGFIEFHESLPGDRPPLL